MDPLFTEEQLNGVSREDIISLMKVMWERYQKQETKTQILRERTKELEFPSAILSDRLTLAQRKQFSPSNEEYTGGYTQLSLFNEAEREADLDAPGPEVEEIHPSSYKRKKCSGKKKENLPVFETTEIIEYKLTGADRNCPDCSTKYKVVTKEAVRRLKFVPAWFEVAEEIAYAYSCPKYRAMKRPEKTPSLLRGSVAVPPLVAGTMNAEYMGGMPLVRQEQELVHYDLNLSTKTTANWIIQCAGRYLQLLYELVKGEFLRSRYIHRGETCIRVTGEPEQKGSTQNWVWVYLTDEYSGSPQMVLFQYERTRAGYHPMKFLGDQFQGYFTCDGYQAYHSLPGRIAVTGCMAHARRRFNESMTVLKKSFTKEQLRKTTTYQTMTRIGMSYKIEEMIRGKPPEKRCEERQKQAKLLLEAFFEWLHTLGEVVDRSSKIGEAVPYTPNQETYLKRYLGDGHPSIDNLAVERALKNFAIGRHNWLFAKSIRRVQASATVCSITETALLNGLKPHNYLTYVMEKMKDLGAFPAKEEVLELLS